MKALAMVFGFWAFVGLLLLWALGMAWSVDNNVALAVVLGAIPALGLSAFMWLCFKAMLDDF